MAQFRPTQNDLKDIESLERTFKNVFDELYRTPASIADAISALEKRLPALLKTNLTVIQQGLQANGTAPLNLTSLPGTPASGGLAIEDTHANRSILYPASSQPVGSVFVETDRTYVYVVELVSGANTWVWVGGLFIAAFAGRPADLGTTDAGALFFASDRLTQYTWNGSAWKTTGGALEEPITDGVTAFQVRNAAGSVTSLDVDTTNNRVGVAGNVAPATALNISSGTPTTAAGGIRFGTDASANLYRSAAGVVTCDGVLAASQLQSTVAIGTAPLLVTSTTVVANLNVSKLLGQDWASPGQIGITTPAVGVFTSATVTAADSNSGAGTVTLGTTQGIGAGALTNMQAPVIGAGTGPTTAVTVVNWLRIDIAGTKYWIPLMQ